MLVLDEPGNHLDVETVEALAEALLEYKGTVVFTSHDRHFMHRVATSVIEVRDGSVKNYFGDYDTYLLSVENEVDAGERERMAQAKGKTAPAGGKPPADSPADHRQVRRDQRKTDKEIKNLEKKIAKLDEEKRELNAKMLTETDPNEAMRLHEAIEKLNAELAETEQRWLELSEEAWQ